MASAVVDSVLEKGRVLAVLKVTVCNGKNTPQDSYEIQEMILSLIPIFLFFHTYLLFLFSILIDHLSFFLTNSTLVSCLFQLCS